MRAFFLLIVLFLAQAVGCNDNDMVAGRKLVLESQEGAPRLAGAQLELRFSGDHLSVYAGCNQISTAYTIRGGTLRVDGVTSTLMLCEPAVDVEEWFQQYLQEHPAIEVLPSGGVVLKGKTARLLFVDPQKRRPVRLAGRGFSLQSQDGAPNLQNAHIDLNFAAARFSARACNYQEGRYEVRDRKLVATIEAISTMACEGDGHAHDEWMAEFLKEQPEVDTPGQELVLRSGAKRLVFAEKKPD